MGASVIGYWPDITESQLESQPGFENDSRAFGNWMVEREAHPDALAALDTLGVRALKTFVTEGIEADAVMWVTPQDLARAAAILAELVLARDPRVDRIVETYAMSANGIDPIHEEFVRDLDDVEQIARFAESEEVQHMTLEVNW